MIILEIIVNILTIAVLVWNTHLFRKQVEISDKQVRSTINENIFFQRLDLLKNLVAQPFFERNGVLSNDWEYYNSLVKDKDIMYENKAICLRLINILLLIKEMIIFVQNTESFLEKDKQVKLELIVRTLPFVFPRAIYRSYQYSNLKDNGNFGDHYKGDLSVHYKSAMDKVSKKWDHLPISALRLKFKPDYEYLDGNLKKD